MMDKVSFESARQLAQDVIFSGEPKIADAMILLNWLDDHRPVRVNRYKNGFLTLCYCGRCSRIVGEGDSFCNGCGRVLIW